MKMLVIAAIATLSVAIAHAEDTPRQTAERLASLEMARAKLEKLRNDAIVEKQRTGEKAAKEAKGGKGK